MQTVGVDHDHWRGRRVLVTGHTGFFGGWLSLWLSHMGAEVTGIALDPPEGPSLFEGAGLDGLVRSVIADIRDAERLKREVEACSPQTVFHLAAQAIVREAHAAPVETFAVNVMGTVHLMEALRAAPDMDAAVIVTTDKVYDNVEWDWGYRENDPLGAKEPYGGSKACAEHVVDTYRRSYLGDKGIATVRAGNIIGGGDWAADRLIPDAIRAFSGGEALHIRNPMAVRPWQHALEPSRGLLTLAQKLAADPNGVSGPWNFGPSEADSRPVIDVVENLVALWGDGASWQSEAAPGIDAHAPYEARLLTLNSMKALSHLGWKPQWSFERALSASVDWYRAHFDGGDMRRFSFDQIAAYEGAN